MPRRIAIHAAAAILAALVTASTGCAQSPDSLRERGEALLKSGQYEDARVLFRRLLDAAPADDAALGLASAYAHTGDYEEGLEAVDELIAGTPDAPRLIQARGRLLVLLGRFDEAEEAFRNALNVKTDLWTCGIDLADLFARTGRDREAQSIYSRVFQEFQRGTFRTVETLTAGGRAAAEVGRFRDANEAYRTAYRLDGENVENLYAWAELFREKYNDADAQRTYQDALTVNARHAPSLVGLAHTARDFERKEELAQEALRVNPSSTSALSLLAGLRVLDGLYDEAEQLAEEALSVNPSSIYALGQLASVYHLRADTTGFAGVESRALEVDPLAGDFYLALAENASLRFRYVDAASFAERAVQTDRSDQQARAELGTALLRLGREADARRHLQAAFDADPYNLFASNMLTLLDEYEHFSMLESAHFRLWIHEEERDVLGPAMLEMAEASYDSLRQRYPYDPADKIRIEAYGDPDDFAVRIAGVPHRGLLGVSFGDVLAVNTPRAQTGSSYNWARTLWHEIAHTMAMGVSENHVPRWFTEGLSIYEEKRAQPHWAREMDLGFFSALDRDLLLPLEEIDRGFTRPSFPGQIQLSYYHAGLVVEHIVDTFGFDAIVHILEELRTGRSDDAAVAAATGLQMAQLDAQFRAAMDQRVRQMREALEGLPDVLENEEADVTTESMDAAGGPLFERLRAGAEHLRNDRLDDAEAAFEQSLSIYQDYAGPGNAYEGLASVYRERNDTEALVDILERYLLIAEHETDAALELAAVYEEGGRPRPAAELLERSLHVIPYDVDLRSRLADLYERMNSPASAVLHRRAILGLDPPNRAVAQFDLARVLQASGRQAEARRAVLQSLELAPDFRDAQKLLLEIVE
jgi:tetratricopeptide (TPR) repeat protein